MEKSGWPLVGAVRLEQALLAQRHKHKRILDGYLHLVCFSQHPILPLHFQDPAPHSPENHHKQQERCPRLAEG